MDKRFEEVYSQGTLTVTEIWVDRETGVTFSTPAATPADLRRSWTRAAARSSRR